jgi:hypothetical protein
MTTEELLARVRAGVPRLAELIVAEALATPVEVLAAPAREFVLDAARTLARDDAAAQALVARTRAFVAALPTNRLADILPPPVVAGLKQAAELHWSVPRDLTLRLLDRPPVRQLLRAQVLRTLVDFTRRATAPFTENVVARGLSKLAFGGPKNPTAFGSLRNVVSGEAERRAEGFADTAVDEVIAGIARELADPSRAREQAAIRVAVIDALLDETGGVLAGLSLPQVGPLVDVARRALAAWEASLPEDLVASFAVLLEKELARPLGDVLADFGLRDVVERQAIALVVARLGMFVEREPFARWVEEITR